MMARRVTATWLGKLRGFHTFKDILLGEEVELHTSAKNAQLFSADLSAATDHIDHYLAKYVAELFNRKIGRPDLIEITDKIFSNKQVGDSVTTCGIHMGLGCSWTVLSLLNGYAAWFAGAKKESHAICGDDLIGAFTRHQSQVYTRTLEELGLVVNHAKSFYGKRGVFCERIVSKTGPHTWMSKEVGHLSQLTAARCEQDRERSRITMARNLQEVKTGKKIAQRTINRIVPGLPTGPRFLGLKGGKARTSDAQILSHLMRSSLPQQKRRLVKRLVEEVKTPFISSVPITVLSETLDEIEQRTSYLQGKKYRTHKEISDNSYIRSQINFLQESKQEGTKSVGEFIKSNLFTGSNRKTRKQMMSSLRLYHPNTPLNKIPNKICRQLTKLAVLGCREKQVTTEGYEHLTGFRDTLRRVSARYAASRERRKDPNYS
jgi:hypothetical protein